MDILLDSRFCEDFRDSRYQGRVTNTSNSFKCGFRSGPWPIVTSKNHKLWKGQNTDYVSAEKDKGPAFSGTVLIWEASWLWHIILHFPPIQNGRSRPTVWPDKPLKLEHSVWNQMPSDVLHDTCMMNDKMMYANVMNILGNLSDKFLNIGLQTEVLNECVLLILKDVQYI